MNIDKQLSLASGEKLLIPQRLYQIITTEKISEAVAPVMDDQDRYMEAILNSLGGQLLEGSLLALQAATFFQKDQQRCDESVFYVCLYANGKARLALEAGDQEVSFELFSDSLELGNSAFSYIQPSVARYVADQMTAQSEEVIRLCTLSGSIQALASRKVDLDRALDIALTFWEPEFAPIIQIVKRDLEIILKDMSSGLNQENRRRIHETSMLLKKEIQKKISYKPGAHPETLRNLVEAVLEMFQQEIVLSANTTYTSDGLDSETIQYQAKRLVEQVEKRLRVIIAKKYRQQFGESWLQHISSKHQPMYERWQRYMQKDQSAFRLYNDYAPEALDYALIDDLKELIIAQWHLFREMFNFGYQDRNKAVFLDKVSQIISVRNALAHHRMPPENELLRTRVLSTDILLALDRLGETSE